MASKADRTSTREAIDACLDVLKEDPPRLKRLLREAAALLDDVSEVLADARRTDDAKKAHLVAKLVRGTAILPASLAAAALKKAASKFL